MKKIKNAKSISDLIKIVSKQCRKERCRVGIWFNSAKDIQQIVDDGFVSDLPFDRHVTGLLRIRFDRPRNNNSWMELISLEYPYPRGKKYDYILIDSTLSDEAKIIARAMTVRGHFYVKNDKMCYRRDKRKNTIQEFTLADEWPLLSKTK